MYICKDCQFIFNKPEYDDGTPICPDCASEHIASLPDEPVWTSMANYDGD
jgi:predicted Zn-ribbon and HTH transcriptional regulator